MDKKKQIKSERKGEPRPKKEKKPSLIKKKSLVVSPETIPENAGTVADSTYDQAEPEISAGTAESISAENTAPADDKKKHSKAAKAKPERKQKEKTKREKPERSRKAKAERQKPERSQKAKTERQKQERNRKEKTKGAKVSRRKGGKNNASSVVTIKRKANGDVSLGVKGIGVKLNVAFMIPVILFVIVGLLIYNKSSSILRSTYEASATTSVGTLEQYLDLGFENITLMATRLSINSAIQNYYTGSGNKSEGMLMDAKLALSNEATADTFIDHIIVIARTGSACYEQGAIKEDLYNAFIESEEGKFVEENIGTGSMWISKHPSIDALTGFDSDEYALSMVSVLRNNTNKAVGYILIDVKTSFIQNILDDAQISEGSIKGFVLEDGGQVVSGHDSIVFSENEFYQDAKNGEDATGSREVTYDGAKYLFVYSRVSDSNMMVCAMVPQSEITAGARTVLIYTLVAVAVCAIIAIVVGTVLASGIAKAIRKVNRILKKTSDGDLTGQISMKRKDEFRVLSSSITDMIGSMKDLILKMTNVSGHVSDSAVQVNSNSEILLEVTKQITEAVQYINDGISQQAQDTEECLGQMNDLAGKIAEVHTNTNNINAITQSTQAAIDDGMVTVENLGHKVNDTNVVIGTVIREIAELSKESAAISSIIGTINEIADQTNLLSLNASIEAARAGEAGRGFAVVSDEIRKLAEQSGKAGNRISQIVEQIQERIEATIETAGTAEESVEFQTAALAETVEVFKEIRHQVALLGDDVEKITESVSGIERAKQDTMSAIESISATSNETESSAEELQKSTERQLQAVEVLNDAVQRLQTDAEDLDASVSIFKL